MIFCYLIVLFGITQSYNIDIDTPYLLRGQSNENFGFSVALHNYNGEGKLLVSAPKATTSQPGVDRGGAVYSCPIPSSLDTPRSPVSCSSQVTAFDDTGNKYLSIDNGNPEMNADGSYKYNYDNKGYLQENKTDQWMGISLKSSGDFAVACAHLYVRVAHNYRKQTYDTQPIGKCSLLPGSLTGPPTIYRPCWGDQSSGYEFYSCQAGSSVDIAGDDLLFGGPGARSWEGRAYVSQDFTKSETKTTNVHDAGGIVGQWFTGYATVICDVNGDGVKDYIVTGPRADNYKGQVFIYNVVGSGMPKKKTIDGSQIGEYFGHTVDCGDVNGDGHDDIIIGAPYYSRDTSGHARLQSTGRVYVYYGSKELYVLDTPTIIEATTKESTHFGHAIKVVGDMNKDGYKDVLVSAPFDASGIVYLYLGSAKGLETEFSQSIRPENLAVSTSMNTFGWSLDGDVDMDSNSYPDILIGTLDSYAVYLRSLPIIDLSAQIVIDPSTPIDTENESLKVDVPNNPVYQAVSANMKLCFTYISGLTTGQGEKEIEVNYTITADYKNERGYRMYYKLSEDEPKSQTMTGRMSISTSGDKICSGNFPAYFNDEIYDFRHIYYRLQADVKDSATFSGRVTLNQKLIEAADARVVMQSGCTKPSGVCQSDLRLAPVTYQVSPKGYDQIAIDTTDYVLFNINVTNYGEDDAFLSELVVTLPRDIIFNRRVAIGTQVSDDVSHVKCITKQEEDFVNKVVCQLSSELQVGYSEVFGISVVTSNIEDMRSKELKFNFEARVNEPSEELATLLDDNKQTIVIKVGYPARLELRGRPFRETQPYNNDKAEINPSSADKIGPDVRHELEISISENSGYSSFSDIQLEIRWPLYMAETRKFLLYLVDIFIAQGQRNNIVCDSKNFENPNNYQEELYVKSPTKRSTASDAPPQDCSEGDSSACVTFTCTVKQLAKGETANIQFRARLWEDTLYTMGNINVTSYVQVISVAQSDVVFGPEGKSTMKSQFYPSTATVKNYLWIIIGSIIAGILLLIILIIVLWKCGFFKRKAPPSIAASAHDAGGAS